MFRFLLVVSVCAVATSLLCLTLICIGQLNPLEALLLFPVGVLGVLAATDAV
jgi:hypothetical protein